MEELLARYSQLFLYYASGSVYVCFYTWMDMPAPITRRLEFWTPGEREKPLRGDRPGLMSLDCGHHQPEARSGPQWARRSGISHRGEELRSLEVHRTDSLAWLSRATFMSNSPGVAVKGEEEKPQ